MSTVLGMNPITFLVAVGVAIGLLMLYRPKDATIDRSKLVMAFVAVLFLGVLFWPAIAPIFTIGYGVK